MRSAFLVGCYAHPARHPFAFRRLAELLGRGCRVSSRRTGRGGYLFFLQRRAA